MASVRPASAGIRTEERPACYLCGTKGAVLYGGLEDRLFGAPGRWGFLRCPNPACGLVWLSPAPVEDDLPLAYSNYYTHSTAAPGGIRRLEARLREAYERYGFGYPLRRRAVLGPLLRLAALLHPGGPAELGRGALYLPAPASGATLVEVGSGSGELLAHLAALGWRTSGVETDAVAAAAARERGLDVHSGDLFSRRYPAGFADAACLVHVIEHVQDPRALLREVARVLKPGGAAVLLTPNLESLAHREFDAAWVSLDPPRHQYVFSAGTLSRLVEEAGLAAETSRTTARGARGAWIVGRGIKRAGRWGDTGRLPSVVSHLRAVPFQLRERMRVARGSPVGEELVLVARKPYAPPT